MKEVIKNYYSIIFRLTGAKTISYYCSVIIVSILCLVCLIGLAMLLDGFPSLNIIQFLFKYPNFIGVYVIVFLLNLTVAPISKVAKRDKKKINIVLVILSLVISLIVYFYIMFVHIATKPII